MKNSIDTNYVPILRNFQCKLFYSASEIYTEILLCLPLVKDTVVTSNTKTEYGVRVEGK